LLEGDCILDLSRLDRRESQLSSIESFVFGEEEPACDYGRDVEMHSFAFLHPVWNCVSGLADKFWRSNNVGWIFGEVKEGVAHRAPRSLPHGSFGLLLLVVG